MHFSYRWWIRLKCEMMLIWCTFSIFYQFLMWQKQDQSVADLQRKHAYESKLSLRKKSFLSRNSVRRWYECSIKNVKSKIDWIILMNINRKLNTSRFRPLSYHQSGSWLSCSMGSRIQMGFQLMHPLHYKYKREFIFLCIKELLIQKCVFAYKSMRWACLL